MAGGDRGSRRREIAILRNWPAPLLLGGLQRFRGLLTLGDIDEGDDDAFDSIVLGAVRQYAATVPCAALRFDFSLERLEGFSTIRASAISALSEASELRSARGRPMSPGMTLNRDLVAGVKKRILRSVVEKERRNIGAVENILQIVGRRALPL